MRTIIFAFVLGLLLPACGSADDVATSPDAGADCTPGICPNGQADCTPDQRLPAFCPGEAAALTPPAR